MLVVKLTDAALTVLFSLLCETEAFEHRWGLWMCFVRWIAARVVQAGKGYSHAAQFNEAWNAVSTGMCDGERSVGSLYG